MQSHDLAESKTGISRDHILNCLRETDDQRLESLWRRADDTRRRCVGNDVHLRALLEISNHCRRKCAYCGLNAENEKITRYRMTASEIIDAALGAADWGYGTVVMQSGEDPGIETEWMSDIIKRIKSETGMAVTLSLGERDLDELSRWKEAGADRYLLKFETSNRDLYERIHPSLQGIPSDRLQLLRKLRQLGYEIGTGIMVGVPGQSWDDLANDIETLRDLSPDMIGLGPYIPDPDTPLGREYSARIDENRLVSNSPVTACKTLALTRLVCPRSNMPSTTALAVSDPIFGHFAALERGANVIMINITPSEYREHYRIYPSKSEIDLEAGRIVANIYALGRTVGKGRGDSPHFVDEKDEHMNGRCAQ